MLAITSYLCPTQLAVVTKTKQELALLEHIKLEWEMQSATLPEGRFNRQHCHLGHIFILPILVSSTQ
jgi:hypothetical protein